MIFIIHFKHQNPNILVFLCDYNMNHCYPLITLHIRNHSRTNKWETKYDPYNSIQHLIFIYFYINQNHDQNDQISNNL